MASVPNLPAGQDAPGSEAWSTKIRKRARSLARIIDTGYMELAEILYKVWDTPINGDPNNASVCVSWGYSNYKEWAAEELGMHSRQAERLKNIYGELEIRLKGQLDRRTRKRIRNLGLSKVRELVRVLSGANAERWVEMAENLTHPELCVAITKALEEQERREKEAETAGEEEEEENGSEESEYPDPPEDINRFKWKNFFLTPEQKANVKLALDRAKELSGSDLSGHNLDLICTDFLSTNDFRLADDPERGVRFLAKFERLMGRRIVVINPDDWTIEYGVDALTRVAEAADEGEK